MNAWVDPPHEVLEESGVTFTFTNPPGVVVRIIKPVQIDGDIVAVLTHPLRRRLPERFPDSEHVYVHDWSRATGYEVAARTALTNWVIRHRHEIGGAHIVSPESDGALLRVGVSTAALTLRPFRVRLRLHNTLEQALDAAGVQRAD